MIFDIQMSVWDIENIGGSGGEAPREKKMGILPCQNEIL